MIANRIGESFKNGFLVRRRLAPVDNRGEVFKSLDVLSTKSMIGMGTAELRIGLPTKWGIREDGTSILEPL